MLWKSSLVVAVCSSSRLEGLKIGMSTFAPSSLAVREQLTDATKATTASVTTTRLPVFRIELPPARAPPTMSLTVVGGLRAHPDTLFQLRSIGQSPRPHEPKYSR